MTPAEQADILADKCTDAIIEAPEAKHTQDIIRDTCCLVEFFEVVRAAEEQSKDGPMFRCDPNKLKNALTALRAKLPKEIEL